MAVPSGSIPCILESVQFWLPFLRPHFQWFCPTFVERLLTCERRVPQRGFSTGVTSESYGVGVHGTRANAYSSFPSLLFFPLSLSWQKVRSPFLRPDRLSRRLITFRKHYPAQSRLRFPLNEKKRCHVGTHSTRAIDLFKVFARPHRYLPQSCDDGERTFFEKCPSPRVAQGDHADLQTRCLCMHAVVLAAFTYMYKSKMTHVFAPPATHFHTYPKWHRWCRTVVMPARRHRRQHTPAVVTLRTHTKKKDCQEDKKGLAEKRWCETGGKHNFWSRGKLVRKQALTWPLSVGSIVGRSRWWKRLRSMPGHSVTGRSIQHSRNQHRRKNCKIASKTTGSDTRHTVQGSRWTTRLLIFFSCLYLIMSIVHQPGVSTRL